MIASTQEQTIRELAVEKVSQREIARRVGISRTSVQRVINGKERPKKKKDELLVDYYFCGGCKMVVKFRPCVVCSALRAKK